MMDRRYIDENHIVARYLADRLSDEERTAFEAYYLQHPEIVKEMESAARFKGGLMLLQDKGELGDILNAPPRSHSSRWVAAAAGIAAIALVAGFLVSRERVRPLLVAAPTMLRADDGTALAITETYQLLRTRSTTADAVVLLPATAQAIELEILPETEAAAASYQVALSRIEGSEEKRIAQVERLSPNESGFVEVFLDSRGVQPGRYVVELTTDSNTPPSVFSLRVEAAQ